MRSPARERHGRRKFVSDVLVRGITQIVVGLRGFVFLPVVSRTLGIMDYGIWSQVMISIALVAPILTLQLPSACVRYLPGEAQEDRRNVLLAVFALTGVVLLSLVGVCLPLAGWVSQIVFGNSEFAPYTVLLLLLVVVEVLFRLAHNYFRATNSIKLHSFIQLIRVLIEVSVVTVMLVFLDGSLRHALVALVAIGAVMTIGLILGVINDVGIPRFFDGEDSNGTSGTVPP